MLVNTISSLAILMLPLYRPLVRISHTNFLLIGFLSYRVFISHVSRDHTTFMPRRFGICLKCHIFIVATTVLHIKRIRLHQSNWSGFVLSKHLNKLLYQPSVRDSLHLERGWGSRNRINTALLVTYVFTAIWRQIRVIFLKWLFASK